jgi:hypothetical protein
MHDFDYLRVGDFGRGGSTSNFDDPFGRCLGDTLALALGSMGFGVEYRGDGLPNVLGFGWAMAL